MAVQPRGDLFRTQGSIPTLRKFQPVIMAVGVKCPRRKKMQFLVDGRIMLIYYGLPKRLSSTLERGRPQFTTIASNVEERPVSNRLAAPVKLAPVQRFVRGKELSIADAIADLKNRQQRGISIDSYTLVDVLKRCSNQKDLTAARQVHNCIISSGMDQHPYVVTALMNVYIRCGRLRDARRVFDGLEKKTVVAWTIMVAGYAKNDHTEDALETFNRMRLGGSQPDDIMCLCILKACHGPLALKWGKEVHAYIRHAYLEPDRRVGTALVQMYANCGCIAESRRVFEKLTNRDIITWNVMIGAYSKSGCGVEAYELFLQMRRRGFEPNVSTYVSILNASASAGALAWVKEVHGHARKAGLESELRVGTALVHMYAKSGSIDDARLVFDSMEKRNVVTWNVIVGAYAESGCGVEAYELFLQMKREGLKPDAFTFASILNASASAGALDWVKEVGRDVLKAGLQTDLHVGNALVHMYAKSGSIDDARVVFDKMEIRNVITWNVLIGAYAGTGCGVEAYELFLQMKRAGCIPDAFTYASILNASASAGALEWMREVHSDAHTAGLESDLRVGSALVHMYAKSGSIDDARVVFNRLEKRNVITWNVMIGAYAESGCGAEAYELLLQMKREGFEPNAITFVSILNASASAGALEWVKDVHDHARRAGLESELRVGTALVHMYAKSGSITDARLVFDRMETRNVVTWTVIIGAYAASGFGVQAYELFLQMKREGFVPNAFTYASILNPSASTGALNWVTDVHGHARRAGLESELHVGTALVHMYAKSGSINDARLVFDKMKQRDVVTWAAMIGGLALHGCGGEALKLFEKMIADYVKPNETIFVAVLSACCHAGLIEDGRRVFLAMKGDYGIEPTVVHYNCVVDLLGRAGHLDEAKLLIDKMPVEPNAITWTALLGACRTYCNVELGELAAEEVLKLEPEDAGAYVLLSNIYAGAGKWEKVSLVRSMMQERGIRKEPGRSWIEVDNKIHEFVVGDKSHPATKAIYGELKKLSEQLKAKGYIPDTKLVLRNMDEEEKEVAICSHSEKLAIAYGLLRVPRGKSILVEKNLRICSDCHAATKLISEVTGREITVRDANRFHHFKDGGCSCGDYW